MHSAIARMLERYACKTLEDRKNALREILQEIALLGLYRGGFFSIAAFNGGTALRIFHQLDRFSEDLDFSLELPDPELDLAPFLSTLTGELASFGLQLTVETKARAQDTGIRAAVLSGNSRVHLLQIFSASPLMQEVHENERFRIKLEVDVNPPAGAGFESKILLLPVPFPVRVFTLPSLFAGKLHAVIARGWKNRVKGRDFYDYVWFLSRGIQPDTAHLASRLRRSGHLAQTQDLTRDLLLELLYQRFASVDFDQARRDVLPFIRDPATLDLWSAEFFTAITTDRLQLT
jgi:predicted nucleotidyltransferase component of viral defense system